MKNQTNVWIGLYQLFYKLKLQQFLCFQLLPVYVNSGSKGGTAMQFTNFKIYKYWGRFLFNLLEYVYQFGMDN